MSEKEYIERGAVINEINNLLSEYEDCDGKFLPKHLIPSGLCRALIFIKQQPAADVQEVVRCKDCRWSDHLTDVSLRCNNLKVVMPPCGFCCYGEIRSEQE